MFEKRKTITVNGISFDMILVEGDKFTSESFAIHTYKDNSKREEFVIIGGKRDFELDDFYMAEIPVTQELYMAVMGTDYSCSHKIVPDIFNPLNNLISNQDVILIGESLEERLIRQENARKSRLAQERIEQERIKKLSKHLPVNNITWAEAFGFIKKIRELTGLNFDLPSFEQWYFAANGGIESKNYDFSGSNDANEVGHFQNDYIKPFKKGLYVMTGETNSDKYEKPKNWYQKPKQYKPNELGLYDMSGLVYEWLDTPGKLIGGSYFSEPEKVGKKYLFGYSDEESLKRKKTMVLTSGDAPIINLFGFRLILSNKPKHYKIPERKKNIENNKITCQENVAKINVSPQEKEIIDLVYTNQNLNYYELSSPINML